MCSNFTLICPHLRSDPRLLWIHCKDLFYSSKCMVMWSFSFLSFPLSSPVINTKCHTQWTWMFQSMAFKKYRFPSFIINCICTPYFLSIRLSTYAALLYVQIQHLACLISKSKIKIKRPKCASNVSSTSCILVLHPDYCEAVLWQSPFLNVLYK